MTVFNNSDTAKALAEIKKALSERIRTTYPHISPMERDSKVEEILKIHGLNSEKFNIVATMESMIESKTIAEKSIDDNSNKNEKGVASAFQESVNSHRKLVGYRTLYRALKKLYGKDEAKRLSGMMYDYSLGLADSSKILLPYCWAGDFSSIVLEGRSWGQLYSKPAKTIRSYVAALNETVHSLSNHLAGACAIASFFTDISKVLMDLEGFTLKDLEVPDKRKYIENCFQTFVHSMNSLSRTGGTESPFTNISIFDRVKILQKVKDLDYYFDNPDSEYVADFIMEVQRIYMDFFSKGDPTKNGIMYRFPVSTINITKDKDNQIIDGNFLNEITKQEIFRYNIFVSEESKDASCCFSGDTPILVKSSTNGVELLPIKELAHRTYATKNNLTAFHDGSWSRCKTVKTSRGGRKMYEIVTSNNKKIKVTEDHLFPTIAGIDKRADELTSEDYLLFNTTSSHEVPEQKLDLTYNDGLLVGAYLGDGSMYKASAHKGVTVTLSMNKDKVEKLKEALNNLSDLWRQYEEKHNVVKMITADKNIANIIDKWVSGGKANLKRLNLECLQQSIDFRKGILDGLYATDGGNSNRIYTTSTGLRDDMESLLTSLGLVSVLDEDDRTDQVRQFRDEKPFTPNFPVQCIRWYSPKNKRRLKDLFIRRNGNTYFKIESVKEIHYEDDLVYCLEMINQDEPYFTLPNGIITHNCRMLSSEEMLALGAEANSFGGGGIGRLGSHRVITVDYFRIAKTQDTFENYIKEMLAQLDDSCKVLRAHRNMLIDLQSKGLQPFIDRGYIDMTRMFSTFGIMGIVEAAEVAESKYEISKEDFIGKVLEEVNKSTFTLASKYKMPINVEQIPGESFSHRLPRVNRILLGDEDCSYPLFTNQFIPMWEDASLWERMEIDGKYGKMFTGGGIVHFSLGERTLPKQNEKIIKYAVKTGCEHFSLNPIYSVCEDCGNTKFAKLTICDKCSSDNIEYYTRTVGFFTPVKSGWSKPKQDYDFNYRVFREVNT